MQLLQKAAQLDVGMAAEKAKAAETPADQHARPQEGKKADSLTDSGLNKLIRADLASLAGGQPALPFSCVLALVGTCMFFVTTGVLCALDLSDPEMQQLFHEKADLNCYTFPMVAFITAFSLNFLTLVFERDPSKFQLAFIACYITLLAGTTDCLEWLGLAPIIRDGTGNGVQLLRLVMWGYATPAMVYLLSMLSDCPKQQVLAAISSDIAMIVFGILFHVVHDHVLMGVFFLLSCAFFVHVLWALANFFGRAIEESNSRHARRSLALLRAATMGLWCIFPAMEIVIKLGWVDVRTEEWVWCILDFLGKVVFSSSLLQGNFVTMEQRRVYTLKAIEEANRLQVIQELKELVQHKEAFMSSMSHELRTPLNGIIGLSDALLVGSCGALNDATRKTVTTIKTSGSRLLTLINDILDAAAMRRGKLIVKQERVNLRKVVEDVVELTQPLVKRNVKLVNDVPPNIPYIMGDTGRIIQIFHNLIGNSSKFTHQGFITVSARVRQDEVEISVSDTGIGIPSDKFEQIFQAFEQVDMSTTRKYGGTGLGLNLVKQLVEAHGGSVSVISKEGVGTTFSFNVKVHAEQKGPAHSASTTGMAYSSAVASSGAAAPGSNAMHGYSHSASGVPAPASSAAQGGAAATHVVRGGFGSSGSNAGAVHAAFMMSDGAFGGASASSLPSNPVVQALRTDGSKPPPRRIPSRKGSLASLLSILPNRTSSDAAEGLGPDRRPSDGTEGVGVASTHGGSTLDGYTDGGSPMMVDTHAPYHTATAVTGRVSLQLTAGDASRRMAGVGGRRQHNAQIRVLSVDDDPVNQLVIQNLLSPVGYEIIQAMDGQEALDILRDEASLPDIILLDVMMPGMSGYEVCRKLREMYPLSCIPVIMVSAKSKEEHIVEGLASGSNDYVVKPFGRQEILARINAHLNFRDSVYQAGELAGAMPEDMVFAPSVLIRGSSGSGPPVEIGPFLRGDAKFYSLPHAMREAIEACTAPTSIQVFDQLTLININITNMPAILRSIPGVQLLQALAQLFYILDSLLAVHGCHLVETLDGRIKVVSGLGDTLKGHNESHNQAAVGIALCKDLLMAARQITLNNAAGKDAGLHFDMAFGVHTGACQGVLVGHKRPLLYFTGVLPSESHALLETCPPNCIHVSSRVVEAAGTVHQFVLAGRLSATSTYLVKAGLWDRSTAGVMEACDAWSRVHPNTHGTLDITAKRSRPIQLAVITLLQNNPAFLVDLCGTHVPYQRHSHASGSGPTHGSNTPVAHSTRTSGEGLAIGAVGQALPAAGAVVSGSFAVGGGSAKPLQQSSPQQHHRAQSPQQQQQQPCPQQQQQGGVPSDDASWQKLVAKLRHEKGLLKKQLEEVSEEAARLQDVVDKLEEDLMAQTQRADEATAAAGASQAAAAQAQALSREAQEAAAVQVRDAAAAAAQAAAGQAATGAEALALLARQQQLGTQLLRAEQDRNMLQAALADMASKLDAAQQALTLAQHEAAEQVRTLTPKHSSTTLRHMHQHHQQQPALPQYGMASQPAATAIVLQGERGGYTSAPRVSVEMERYDAASSVTTHSSVGTMSRLEQRIMARMGFMLPHQQQHHQQQQVQYPSQKQHHGRPPLGSMAGLGVATAPVEGYGGGDGALVAHVHLQQQQQAKGSKGTGGRRSTATSDGLPLALEVFRGGSGGGGGGIDKAGASTHAGDAAGVNDSGGSAAALMGGGSAFSTLSATPADSDQLLLLELRDGLHQQQQPHMPGFIRSEPMADRTIAPAGCGDAFNSMAYQGQQAAGSGSNGRGVDGGGGGRGSSRGIADLLTALGLAGLAPRFEAEEVTPALLPFLDDDALVQLGATSVGARLKLRLAAQQQQQ